MIQCRSAGRNAGTLIALAVLCSFAAAGCAGQRPLQRRILPQQAKTTEEYLQLVRESRNPAARQQAFHALGNPRQHEHDPTQMAQIAEVLGVALQTESSVPMQLTLLDALASLGGEEAIVAVEEKLASDNPLIRREAGRTLGTLHAKRSVPLLAERLQQDTNLDVRLAAAGALQEIGGTDAATALAGQAEDRDIALARRCRTGYREVTGREYSSTQLAAGETVAEKPERPTFRSPFRRGLR